MVWGLPLNSWIVLVPLIRNFIIWCINSALSFQTPVVSSISESQVSQVRQDEDPSAAEEVPLDGLTTFNLQKNRPWTSNALISLMDFQPRGANLFFSDAKSWRCMACRVVLSLTKPCIALAGGSLHLLTSI